MFNIEMEIAAGKGYPKRILFYWCKLYQSQIHEGDDYHSILSLG